MKNKRAQAHDPGEEFIARSKDAQALRRQGRPRAAALILIKAARRFCKDQFGHRGNIAASLFWQLEEALEDLDDGTVHPIFSPERKGGAPKLPREERTRRWAVGQALELLMQSGKPKKEASAFIARKLKPAEFRKRGEKPISAGTVMEWYHELVNEDSAAVLVTNQKDEKGDHFLLVDGTSDAALKGLVHALIELAAGRAIASPTFEGIPEAAPTKESD